MGESDAEAVPPTGPVEADRFKAAFRHHAAGVAVVAADVAGEPLALTVSSLASVSAEPPVLLFSVSTRTGTGRRFVAADRIVVHLLDADDLPLALRCADPDADRFGDPDAWERLVDGEPAFVGPRLLLRGRVRDRVVSGEATVVLLDVVEVLDRRPDAPADVPGPLAYHDRRWHVLGDASQVD